MHLQENRPMRQTARAVWLRRDRHQSAVGRNNRDQNCSFRGITSWLDSGVEPSRGPPLQTPIKTAADIAAWCMDYISKTLEIPREKIGLDTKFTRLGLDSVTVTHFMIDLEEWANVELNPEAVFDYPDIAALSEYVAGRCSVPPESPTS
jgi:acyl carrier protein